MSNDQHKMAMDAIGFAAQLLTPQADTLAALVLVGPHRTEYVRADRLAAVEAERDALMEAVQEATEIMRRAVADADDAEAFFLAQEWLAKLEDRE